MILSKRLDLIESKINDENFRTGHGTVGEVNFWIFDYLPADEMAVREYLEYIVRKTNERDDGLRIKHFDLYDLMLDALRQKNYLEKVIDREKAKGSAELINPLKRTLRLTESDDMIIQKITSDLVPEQDIIFLSGVGKAWPIIRSHTILNNLHSRVDKNPLVMFFPGEYTSELKLFGEITDDNYYRAFKLI